MRWDARKPPVSSDGEPFDTVCGRKIATPITITTLTAVKNSDWTTVADVTPATDEPGMLVRKMPIIAAVPACAGVTALIAVPPWDAPHAVLNERSAGIGRAKDVPPAEPDERGLRGLQREREDSQ